MPQVGNSAQSLHQKLATNSDSDFSLATTKFEASVQSRINGNDDASTFYFHFQRSSQYLHRIRYGALLLS